MSSLEIVFRVGSDLKHHFLMLGFFSGSISSKPSELLYIFGLDLHAVSVLINHKMGLRFCLKKKIFT